jgi:hypothetical protein
LVRAGANFNLGGSIDVILNGPDPGNLGGLEEVEAVLDASWAGAAAPAATVAFFVSQSTETTDGTDLSEIFVIDNNLADVMTESFGICEQDAMGAFASAEEGLAHQATAQGGGGGGGSQHTDTITAKFSGYTNYSPSISTGIAITIQ